MVPKGLSDFQTRTYTISESSSLIFALLSLEDRRMVGRRNNYIREAAYCLVDRVTLKNREKDFGYTVTENKSRKYPEPNCKMLQGSEKSVIH